MTIPTTLATRPTRISWPAGRRDMLLLTAPDADELDHAYQRLKALHSDRWQ